VRDGYEKLSSSVARIPPCDPKQGAMPENELVKRQYKIAIMGGFKLVTGHLPMIKPARID
jgi:hypothetical protein